jgi:hypothetical protein
MPPPTELVDGRWQVIGAGRRAVVSSPRRVARHTLRAAAPVAASGAIGGAGTLVCYAVGWPAGLFGPSDPAAGAQGQGGPGNSGGGAPGASVGWPIGLPDLNSGIIGPGVLNPAPGGTPFAPPTSGPGSGPGNGSGSGSGSGPGGSDPGGPGSPGQPPTTPDPGTLLPPDPGGPGQTVPVPEPQATALFVGFLALFAAVLWVRKRRVARPVAD